MEKTIKIWQALVSFALLVITVGTAIVNQSNKIETQRMRIEFLESAQRDVNLLLKDQNQQNAAQFKEVNSKLTDILIILQNKADKRNLR